MTQLQQMLMEKLALLDRRTKEAKRLVREIMAMQDLVDKERRR